MVRADRPHFKALTDPAAHTPLVNRATRGLYAPGSAFKLITSLAMVNTGTRGAYMPYTDTDCYERPGLPKKCSPGGAGRVDLQGAITKSADVYFYSVGDELWRRWKNGDNDAGYAIQTAARQFGFGQKTGIDIGESAGTVPDAAWKIKIAKAIYKTQEQQDLYNKWNPGDNISLAVGQGDLLVSPLQLANAYSALANGGTVWKPRLVGAITDSNGKPVAGAPVPTANAHVEIPKDVRDVLMRGFAGVTTNPSGTAYLAFNGLSSDVGTVYGKTGTAQRGNPKTIATDGCVKQTGTTSFNVEKCIGDTSWFVSMYAPKGTDQDRPRYVVLAMVEEGGRGGRIAAPIVRQIVEHMSHQAITPIPQLVSGNVIGGLKG